MYICMVGTYGESICWAVRGTPCDGAVGLEASGTSGYQVPEGLLLIWVLGVPCFGMESLGEVIHLNYSRHYSPETQCSSVAADATDSDYVF